ncbi:hypothetical protein CIL05_07300 [Virgibacillus profundi]|uniref:Uncharacterized protein n=1 Tax=Virgibacillus profundi TaxID=2024555 RepID=A0A2A2IF42_9BACI|nr:hypothetical protein [Virgibacillus profundi]PAV30267.1 hypothetical protein CIL05_07300 [Virgibacillus profundi]PXY54439.1 hypothetical protein CIT14_07385 [Virgibacillus profundi]
MTYMNMSDFDIEVLEVRRKAKEHFNNMSSEEFREFMGDMLIDKEDDNRVLVGKNYEEILEIINEQVYSADISKLADIARELLDCSWYADHTR